MMGIFLNNEEQNSSAEQSALKPCALGKPAGDPAFDGWLTHHLAQLYDPVVHEPIPADLLRLLEERLK